jgi:hypothetical protein
VVRIEERSCCRYINAEIPAALAGGRSEVVVSE